MTNGDSETRWPRPPRDADPADPNDRGWWLASDGRWYPPESAWFPPGIPTAANTRSPAALMFVLLGAALLIVVVGGFLVVRDVTETSDRVATRGPDSTGVTPPTRPALSTVIPSPATVVVGPSPGESGPLDVAEAQRVAARLWADHVRAQLRGDAPLLKAIEAGPALQADYGYLCYLGCKGPDAIERRQFVNVPRQKSWPVAFEATVEYLKGCTGNQTLCVDTFVLTQQARNRPWKIVFYTTYTSKTRLPEEQPAIGRDRNYAPAPAAPRIGANELLADYANYLDTLKRTGQPPTLTALAPGSFTSGLASHLYDPPQHQRALGYSARVSYRVDRADPTWTFATSQNTMLVCGTVRYAAQFLGVDGRPLVQPPNFSGFGTDVLPGRYSSITQPGLHMVCFALNPTSNAAYVIGSYGADTSANAKPART